MLVEFLLKMLYSVNKNKKAPAYMLKSILISLDMLDFDRPKYKERAQEILMTLKPNLYQLMIDIFKMKDDIEFFASLCESKMKEEKFREVVFICDLFAEIMHELDKKCSNKQLGIRKQLMSELIEQNDITSAKLLVREDEDRIFLVHKQFYKYNNAKKSAQLNKEFKLPLSLIQTEFEEIENIIIQDCMNFYMKQFAVSFKHYNLENV